MMDQWRDFRLIEPLGSGADWRRFRAHDAKGDADVVLTLLQVPDGDVAATLRDARVLSRVADDAVGGVLGADAGEGVVGVWTRWIEGRSLAGVVAEHGALGAAESIAIGVDVCRALSMLHGMGMLHRAVSAHNVIRQQGGRVVLVNPAIGPAGVDTETNVSTLEYVAPERLAGGAASVASDVYAVGVLLFHLVTGAWPVGAGTPAQLRAAMRAGTRRLARDLRPDLPDEFVRVLERAMALDPARRYRSAHDLESALRASTVSKEGAPAGRRWWQNRWWQAMAAGAAGVMAVALAWRSITSPPDFNVQTYVWVEENSGPQRIAGWTSGYRDDPQADPAARYSFEVTTDLPEMFAAGPVVLPGGELEFTPATNAIGESTVTLTLKDRGRPFGVVATSAPRTFLLDVAPPFGRPEAQPDTYVGRGGAPLQVAPVSLPAGALTGSALPEREFTLAFLVQTTEVAARTMLNTRGPCDRPGTFLELRLYPFSAQGRPIGRVQLVIRDAAGATTFQTVSTRSITDDRFHAVAVAVAGDTVSLVVDGILDRAHRVPGGLASLEGGVAAFGGSSCQGVEAAPTMVGETIGLVVVPRSLAAPDVAALYHHGVLANDRDARGGLLSAVLASPPARGQMTLASDGRFTYTPAPGFRGVDQFTYQARNVVGLLSPPTTVTIRVM